MGDSGALEEEALVWYEVLSDDGGRYYWCQQTGESTWEPPEAYVPLPANLAASIGAIIRIQAMFRGRRARFAQWVAAAYPDAPVEVEGKEDFMDAGFSAAPDDDALAVPGLFEAGKTCVICRANMVDYASFPCVCNDTCYDCFEKERDGGEFHCPTCMKPVEEMVHQHDTSRLLHWSNKFKEEEAKEMLQRGDPVRRWGVWQEFSDPDSGERFWFCSKTKELVWDKPVSVLKAERTEHAATRHDEYAYENLGKHFDESAWVKPTVAKAKEFRRRMLFASGRAPICATRPADMMHMGAGVNLYFRILKYFAVVFFVMGVVATPYAYFFYKGTRIPVSDPNFLGIGLLSLGNLGTTVGRTLLPANQTVVTLMGTDMTFEGETVAYLISGADFFNCLFFLLFILFLKFRVSGVIHQTSRKIVSVADYSVFVSNLPRDATEAGIRHHFNDLFRLDCDGVSFLKDHVASLKAAARGRVAPADLKKPQAVEPAAKEASNKYAVPTDTVEPIPSDDIVHLPAHHLPHSYADDEADGDEPGLALPVPAQPESPAQPDKIFTRVATQPLPASGRSHSVTAAGSGSGKPLRDATNTRRGSLPLPPGAKPINFDGTKRRLSIYGQDDSERAGGAGQAQAPLDVEAIKKQWKSKVVRSSRMKLSGKIGSADVQGPVFRPVADVAHVEDDSYKGSWVADVHMVHPIGDMIRKYRSQVTLLEKLRIARATVKMHSQDTPAKKGPNVTKRVKAMKQVDGLFYKIESLRTKLVARHGDKADHCHGAFVTFNNEESYLRCLKQYRHSGSWWRRVFQPKHLRYDFEKSITVEAAPDPSDVVWENLDTGDTSRWLRAQLTTVSSFLLIAMSFVLILMATLAQERFAALIPNLSMCESRLPATFFGGYTNASDALAASLATPVDQQVEGLVYDELALHRHPDLISRGIEDSTCGASRFALRYRQTDLLYSDEACDPAYAAVWAAAGGDSSTTAVNGDLSGGGTVDDVGCPDPRRPAQCPCVDPTSTSQCRTLPCFQPDGDVGDDTCEEFTASTIAGCYCLESLQRYIDERGEFKGLTGFVSDQSDLCGEWAANYFLAQVLTASAAGAVSVVNRVIDISMNKLVAFERHNSVSEAAHALTAKSFVAQFINTAIIALLVSARLPNGYKSPLAGMGVLDGEHEDFSSKWYSTVGVTFVLVVALDTLSHNGVGLVRYTLHKCKRLRAKKEGKRVTQAHLNALYVGPVFSMSERLSQQMVTIFVVLFFSSGLPVMLGLGFVFCCLTYWTDKFLLLRFYTKPPRVDGSLIQFMIRVLPFALMAHLAVAVWMYGNPDLLASADASSVLLSEDSAGHEFLDRWMDGSGGDYDVVGVIPRMLRANTAPFAALLLIMLTYYILKNTAGSILGTLLSKLCFFMRCSRTSSGPKRKWTSAFTSEFAKLMEDGGKAGFAVRSALNKYSAHQRGYRKLTKLEYRQGWRIEDRDGLPVLRKVWNTTMHYPKDAWGKSHQSGDHKRTWEVIADHGLHSYAMHANPVYTSVMHALNESKLGRHIITDSESSSDSGSESEGEK